MARALVEKRLLNTSVTKTVSYTYNLNGSLATLTYPNNRMITYTQGGAGRPREAKDIANSINYATSASYAPFGGLAGMVSGLTGSFSGITTANTYNSRLQPITLSAATTGSGSHTVLSLSYDFHQGSGDNGNVFQIVNNRDTNRTQNFTYDTLNRILSAQTTSNLWGNTYLIDAWGNLVQKNGIVGKSQSESLIQTANQQNQFVGFCHDIAGNMLGTGGCPALPYSPTYVYDAENRLRSILQTITPYYTYDGDGKRVMKTYIVNRLYWTGTGNDTLEETDASGNVTADYIYLNGKRVARVDLPAGNVRYYFSDHLGTASVVTDNLGVIKDESDYYPYGGERVITDADSNRYKFTGKERDGESGFDYFGARYYSSSFGRFMIADWAAKPTAVPYANFGNPQSLNLYSYVKNNPTTLGDPDGHGDAGTFCTQACREASAQYAADHPVAAVVEPIAMLSGSMALATGGAELAGIGEGSILLKNLIGLGLANAPQLQRAANGVAEAFAPPGTPSMSVWNMAPALRGNAVEAQLGANLPKNFPTIDKFVNGAATSIKSLDLNASSYQNVGTLASKVAGYIDKVAGFNGGSYGGVTITSGQITKRVLELAVPNGGSAAQQTALQKLGQYATSKGVQLSVKEII